MPKLSFGITFLFLSLAFSAPVHSAELICVPNSEVIGPNADFGKTETQAARQFVMPSTDYIAVTDNINQQISWAKNHDCSYLLQTTLANSQVNARLMDLKSGEYVFENTYNIKSQNDLPSILERLESTLQHPEFAEPEVETVKEERKPINHLGSSFGYLYFNNIGHMLDVRLTYLWDIKTLWIEAILSSRIGINGYYFNPGIRILYPFSDERNTFYIGSGGGFSLDILDESYGMFVENSFGYLTWLHSITLLRIEAFASAMFHDKKSMGGGLRIIIGISSLKPTKDEDEKENKKEDKKSEIIHILRLASCKIRLAYISYSVPGPIDFETGWGLKAGIVAPRIMISERIIFEPEASIIMRTLTTVNETIHYSNGYSYSSTSNLQEIAIGIPVLLKFMPFGGPWFYMEFGAQVEFPFATTIDKKDYGSRAAFDFGAVGGLGWHIGKTFSFGLRAISGLTNFDNAGREKPIQVEFGVNL